MALIPTIIDKEEGRERAYDIYSRMLKDRIIFLTGEVEENMATSVVAQLLLLEAQDNKADITMYIHSPGGCVHSGLQVIDTMNYIKPDVATVVTGMAASMGAAILSSGAAGKRFALPHAQIMVHQVSSGTRGHVEDQRRSLEHSIKLNEILGRMISDNVGLSYDDYMHSVNRDKWLDSEEALQFGTKGIIDAIQSKRN